MAALLEFALGGAGKSISLLSEGGFCLGAATAGVGPKELEGEGAPADGGPGKSMALFHEGACFCLP